MPMHSLFRNGRTRLAGIIEVPSTESAFVRTEALKRSVSLKSASTRFTRFFLRLFPTSWRHRLSPPRRFGRLMHSSIDYTSDRQAGSSHHDCFVNRNRELGDPIQGRVSFRSWWRSLLGDRVSPDGRTFGSIPKTQTTVHNMRRLVHRVQGGAAALALRVFSARQLVGLSVLWKTTRDRWVCRNIAGGYQLRASNDDRKGRGLAESWHCRTALGAFAWI